jgi:hypothetical protein
MPSAELIASSICPLQAIVTLSPPRRLKLHRPAEVLLPRKAIVHSSWM